MKKIFILLILSITSAAFAADDPKIVFENESVDLGRVEKKTHVKHVFEFKNMGEKPLVIDEIAAG